MSLIVRQPDESVPPKVAMNEGGYKGGTELSCRKLDLDKGLLNTGGLVKALLKTVAYAKLV